MKILIVSNIFIIKESIKSIFINNFDISKVDFVSSIYEIDKVKLKQYDLIFINSETKGSDKENIKDILESKTKIIILDLNINIDLCIKSIRDGIDGYIISLDNNEEFKFIINRIISGRKYYDSIMVNQIINKIYSLTNDELTAREYEIMNQVSKGINNRDIANILNIAECTVKKHISSILNKLNLKNRKDIILYALDKE